MSTYILPTTLTPTFGVEVEFIIATLLEDDDKTDPHEDVEGLPPVLRVPRRYSTVLTQKRYIRGRVKEVLDECFDALPPLSFAFFGKREADILFGHLDWGTIEDSSIRLPSSDSYNFVGIEVTSPVQFASSRAFDAISFAISAITNGIIGQNLEKTMDHNLEKTIDPAELNLGDSNELAPARQRNIPRLRLPQFNSRELLSMRRRLVRFEKAIPEYVMDRVQKRGPGPGVFEATQRIYSQPASCYISSLLSGETRPAISLEGYDCTSLDPENHRRTIEVRFGEGSLDGEWVSIWAKIIVGLFEFALYSSPSKFIDVLENCDRATKEDGIYDVIDFLDDIGLFAEAEIAERRLTANKDRWNLTFVEPES
ncbi:hypothetical protein E0Z10_g2057 [Xylaria hypoxylon]|uniref:Uncharacterized protein n=1 Tax=Xylaria hypoxylon TaxID=37992 RepID=A0A4Z0YS04_9PEZI|nr:hypothetical protein E0Z10_g2057 [Xylaria hypoxylon]